MLEFEDGTGDPDTSRHCTGSLAKIGDGWRKGRRVQSQNLPTASQCVCGVFWQSSFVDGLKRIEESKGERFLCLCKVRATSFFDAGTRMLGVNSCQGWIGLQSGWKCK